MAHRLVRERLGAGGRAVDATAGNGHDTVFLAECVGLSGQVHAFDIQEEAIERTRRVTAGHPQVVFHARGHEEMESALDAPVQAVMFNLGYLPSGDRAVTTRPGTTVTALEGAARLLAPGGILTVVAYLGHPGGEEECDAVRRWISKLDSRRFPAIEYRFANRPNSPPIMFAVEREDPAVGSKR